MGSYESNKRSHAMYCTERRHKTWKLRAQWESNCRPLPLQTHKNYKCLEQKTGY